jgi:hypothetical protein
VDLADFSRNGDNDLGSCEGWSMEIERVAFVFAAKDWEKDLALFELIFGPPTFVDGHSWAQFDSGGSRLCRAVADQGIDESAILLKVDDLDAAAREFTGKHGEVGPPQIGEHEERVTARSTEGRQVVFYRPVVQ